MYLYHSPLDAPLPLAAQIGEGISVPLIPTPAISAIVKVPAVVIAVSASASAQEFELVCAKL